MMVSPYLCLVFSSSRGNYLYIHRLRFLSLKCTRKHKFIIWKKRGSSDPWFNFGCSLLEGLAGGWENLQQAVGRRTLLEPLFRTLAPCGEPGS